MVPVVQNLAGGRSGDVRKNMRMAYNEFAANLVADIADVERALLFGHPGVEHDLQQQVAQFLAEQDVVGVVMASTTS